MRMESRILQGLPYSFGNTKDFASNKKKKDEKMIQQFSARADRSRVHERVFYTGARRHRPTCLLGNVPTRVNNSEVEELSSKLGCFHSTDHILFKYAQVKTKST